MRVTVLTPTLNAERYLADCLRSINEQTYPRGQIQHLILDGGSTDRTIQMAREAGAEVHVEKDGSLYEALNRGISLARGDMIGWLNADDVYKQYAIESVADAFHSGQAPELIVGDYEIASAKRTRVIRASPDVFDRLRAGKEQGSWIIPLAVFWRADTLRSLGKYASCLRVAADLDMWLRAATRSPPPRAAHIGKVMGTFRLHPGSLSMGEKPEAGINEIIDITRRWHSNPLCPAGVRRFALRDLRRALFRLRGWEVRTATRRRRLGVAWASYRDLASMGPGALWDLRWHLAVLLKELLSPPSRKRSGGK